MRRERETEGERKYTDREEKQGNKEVRPDTGPGSPPVGGNLPNSMKNHTDMRMTSDSPGPLARFPSMGRFMK